MVDFGKDYLDTKSTHSEIQNSARSFEHSEEFPKSYNYNGPNTELMDKITKSTDIETRFEDQEEQGELSLKIRLNKTHSIISVQNELEENPSNNESFNQNDPKKDLEDPHVQLSTPLKRKRKKNRSLLGFDHSKILEGKKADKTAPRTKKNVKSRKAKPNKSIAAKKKRAPVVLDDYSKVKNLVQKVTAFMQNKSVTSLPYLFKTIGVETREDGSRIL